jgi:hypothetical protein
MLPPGRWGCSAGHWHQTEFHDNSQLNEHDAVLKPDKHDNVLKHTRSTTVVGPPVVLCRLK